MFELFKMYGAGTKKYKTIIAMITGDKVIELFCMADDFCKFFDRMVAKYTFKRAVKRSYHRNSTMSKAEIMLITVYCCFPKKPCINVERTLDTQLILF